MSDNKFAPVSYEDKARNILLKANEHPETWTQELCRDAILVLIEYIKNIPSKVYRTRDFKKDIITNTKELVLESQPLYSDPNSPLRNKPPFMS